MTLTAWIGLGANLGDREAALDEAVQRLGARLGPLRVSSIVASAAVGRDGAPDPAAPDYLNAAACGAFDGTPRDLLEFLQEIETAMGRPAAEKSLYLPRVIDLDILLIEKDGRLLAVSEPDLVVPHPRLRERPFCLAPLRELGFDPARLDSK